MKGEDLLQGVDGMDVFFPERMEVKWGRMARNADFRVGKDMPWVQCAVPPLKEKKNVVSHHFTEFFEMKAIYIAYKSREMLEYCCT